MHVTHEQGSDWRDWLLLTSIPLVHVGANDQVFAFGSGTMLDFEGRRFLVSAGHVAKIDSKGWAIVVQQHADGRLEYFRPNAFVHVGEGRRSTSSLRMLDLCVARFALRGSKPGRKLVQLGKFVVHRLFGGHDAFTLLKRR